MPVRHQGLPAQLRAEPQRANINLQGANSNFKMNFKPQACPAPCNAGIPESNQAGTALREFWVWKGRQTPLTRGRSEVDLEGKGIPGRRNRMNKVQRHDIARREK